MADKIDRLVFIDETSVNTKMTPLYGWGKKGERVVDKAPYGHWLSQTFIAGLRHDSLVAPWVIDGAMNRVMFNTYIETQLAPTLNKGDVVICDNLASHKSAYAQECLADIGAWFLFLPPYSPDLNPIQMAFSKIKALLRKHRARTYYALWRAIGDITKNFSYQECLNFFNHAGYGRLKL